MSIAAPAGIFAGVTVTAGDGIVVNGAGIKVELRGVSITGLGGVTGINIQNAAKVVIADCRVSGMSGSGLANVGAVNLHVQDSIFRDNGGAGVSLTSGATTLLRVVSRNNGGTGATASGVTLSLIDSQISYNIGTGIAVNSFGYASVNNTVIQLNAGSGIDLTSGANARIDRSVISVNGTYGVHAASGSEVWLLRSTIQDNGQLDGSASEVCACAPFTGVRMSDNAVLSGVSLTALETVTNSTIALYTNNAILGGQLGSGTFQTIPLR
ncbi:MAG: right-handed parallel beta-helix repeat-containing protein [Betaproteobacteria bacterium]